MSSYRRFNVEEIKARHSLSAIIGRETKLRPSGGEFVGLCPFHQENTPSFRVNDAKGVYNCFGCGRSGDAIQFLQELNGLTFLDALALLANGDLPEIDPIDRAAYERVEQESRLAAMAEAFRQWASARDVAGTPAEIYLRSRGITGPLPWSVRFTYAPLRFDKKTGRAAGPRLPALIFACQNASDKIVGVQRVFLTRDGQKAAMRNPKLSLGQTRGCAVRLGPVARRIILCEGPEDGLTLRQRYPSESVWIALGTGGLPFVELPDEVEEVALGGDNNPPGKAAILAGSEAYTEQGRRVRPFFPAPEFEDFNDEHLGILAHQ